MNQENYKYLSLKNSFENNYVSWYRQVILTWTLAITMFYFIQREKTINIFHYIIPGFLLIITIYIGCNSLLKIKDELENLNKIFKKKEPKLNIYYIYSISIIILSILFLIFIFYKIFKSVL
mgnify:CR=1 FL=1